MIYNTNVRCERTHIERLDTHKIAALLFRADSLQEGVHERNAGQLACFYSIGQQIEQKHSEYQCVKPGRRNKMIRRWFQSEAVEYTTDINCLDRAYTISRRVYKVLRVFSEADVKQLRDISPNDFWEITVDVVDKLADIARGVASNMGDCTP